VFMLSGDLVLEDETRPFFTRIAMLMEKGIFPPDAMQFFHQLNLRGWYDGGLPLTVDEAAQSLRALLARTQAGGLK